MKFSETLSDFTMNYVSNEYHGMTLIAFDARKVRRVGNVRKRKGDSGEDESWSTIAQVLKHGIRPHWRCKV